MRKLMMVNRFNGVTALRIRLMYYNVFSIYGVKHDGEKHCDYCAPFQA